ncbi:MAG: rRNA pseudouridine synthase [Chloroflexi bacterium]|nr:rRNA pseudouridine synthase [Chloroflexota bacterium]
MKERIQKLMAHAGIGSRRECEKLIANGRVLLNGRPAKLGAKADPSVDEIVVNGRLIKPQEAKKVYIALNKPKGIISSLDDDLEAGRTTVRDLIPLPGHLYPVGRLDKQSTGLILMTNDGDLAHKLTHPRYGHEKTYRVVVDGRIDAKTVERWQNGIYLDGRKTAPAQITVVQQDVSFSRLTIVMREGRKRQIRRVANMLGHSVKQLVREKIGSLSLDNLKLGEWRHLSDKEVAALKAIVAKSVAKRPRTRTGRKPSKRRPNNRVKQEQKSGQKGHSKSKIRRKRGQKR